MLRRLVRTSLLLSLPIAVSAFLVNLFFFPGGEEVLFRIGPITATGEGFRFALEILARIMAISGAVTLFYLTTRPADLVVDLERRGVSPRVAFVANASVQTVPAMVERASQITAAQRARGLDTEGRIWRRVRGILPIVGPVILGSIAEVEERTMALEARGFTRPGRRTLLWSPPDRVAEALLRWVTGGGPRGADRGARRRVLGMSLVLSGVGYRYAGATRPSLLDVDLELGRGSVVGLAGASEAGKTTLCLVASGLAPRTVGGQIRGRISIDGQDIDGWPMHELSRRVAIGFQNPMTQMSQVAATVFEEVAFGPMNLALPRAEVIERTWEALATLQIDELAERDPLRLSGGQQQLVAMAGLLAMRPEHLVLDEPTAQLDPAGTRLVADAISRLASDGASASWSPSRRPISSSAVASRVIVLADGRVALGGPAIEVLADPELPKLGVAEPSAVRLRRAGRAAGVSMERLERALDG